MKKKLIQKYQNFQKLEKNPKKAFFEKKWAKIGISQKINSHDKCYYFTKIF